MTEEISDDYSIVLGEQPLAPTRAACGGRATGRSPLRTGDVPLPCYNPHDMDEHTLRVLEFRSLTPNPSA